MHQHFLPLLLSFLCVGTLGAQSEYRMKANAPEIDVDFLMGYYQQDGNNAAVTGGIGTEKLNDLATIVVVNVPLDSVQTLNITVGADYYSSASTDNIDNNVSSASSQDLRAYTNVSYSRKNLRRGETVSFGLGFSNEYDYTSFSGRAGFAKEWNEGNSELSLSGQAFFDNWQIIFPIELRQSLGGTLATSSRNSFNFQTAFAQVITPRLQLLLSGEVIYMQGLLSTPFHRVYFADRTQADIERLPDNRIKIPLGIRLTYFPIDQLVLRTNYRYYQDDFGIIAHTIELETPLKISPALSLTPFYRYHTQTASDYFAAYAEHLTSETFYTSDYDLSALSSHKIGLGVGLTPLYGIGRFNLPGSKRLFLLDKLQLRTAYYTRSTGLEAFSVSLNLGIKLK
jgi:hypothetical protein